MNAKARHRRRTRAARAEASARHRRLGDIAAFHADRALRAKGAYIAGRPDWYVRGDTLHVNVHGVVRGTIQGVVHVGTVSL